MPAVDDWLSTEASTATVYQQFCQRGVDHVFSSIGLVVLLPLLFVISGLVPAKLGGKQI